jgi:hypothetical protein
MTMEVDDDDDEAPTPRKRTVGNFTSKVLSDLKVSSKQMADTAGNTYSTALLALITISILSSNHRCLQQYSTS